MKRSVSLYKALSGTLFIAGTSVGAGMLGIPLVTAESGFWPATIMTLVVWFFMYCTGLLYLEATLWMNKDANILSISKRFLGNQGRFFAGITFLFLYYLLLVAYFAAGAPLLADVIETLLYIKIEGMFRFIVFGILFGSIVGIGLSFINRINYILMAGLVLSYLILLSIGSSEVRIERLAVVNFKPMLFAAPILFSAFGYHNVIPSLTFYFERDAQIMKRAILLGSLMTLVIYLLWQWLIIGSVTQADIAQSLKLGEPITEALQRATHNPWVRATANSFGLFAIITSMLGVSFSMVDFLGDGLKMRRVGFHRFILCLITFVPPLIVVSIDPSVFVLAISFAGGFGEAFLNGLLPVVLVWVGRYHNLIRSNNRFIGKKTSLVCLFLFGLLVMISEVLFVMKKLYNF